MNILAAISFYASLVFGFGFGVIAMFNIGRVGTTQFFYWLLKTPSSKVSEKDILNIFGVPTSIQDVVVSMTPWGRLNSFFDLCSYFFQNLGGSLSYYASIYGRFLAKSWFLIGVPAFALSVVLSSEGYKYQPQWLDALGLKTTLQFGITVFCIYTFSYLIGRLIGSPQRDFNKARLLYEDVVARKGYWFGNRSYPNHYSDETSKRFLGKANEMYEKIMQSIKKSRKQNDLSLQRLMTLYYQRALLYCTLSQFQEASKQVEKSIQVKDALRGSTIWDPNENEIFNSQLLFLQGEIALMMGRKDEAKEMFEKSLTIDEELGDSQGIDKNKERLEYIIYRMT